MQFIKSQAQKEKEISPTNKLSFHFGVDDIKQERMPPARSKIFFHNKQSHLSKEV